MYVNNLEHDFSNLKKVFTMILTANNSISCNSKTIKIDACILLYASWHNDNSSYF